MYYKPGTGGRCCICADRQTDALCTFTRWHEMTSRPQSWKCDAKSKFRRPSVYAY